jgi:predicted DNA-binding transcriptional regulator YafY
VLHLEYELKNDAGASHMRGRSQAVDEVYGMIRQAILDKDIVVATYHGHVREMCPHIVGTKQGRQQALLYQFAGGSNSKLGPDGSPDNWRCFRLDEISDVYIKKSAGEWHTASDYSKPQTCIDQIDVQVSS